jgi:hypothetical protein
MGSDGHAETEVSEPNTRGAVLFENDWHAHAVRTGNAGIGIVIMAIGAMIFILVVIISLIDSTMGGAVPLAGLVGIGLGIAGAAVYRLRPTLLDTFRLYETGIQFENGMFVDYMNVHNIEREGGILEYVRIHADFPTLLGSMQYYDVASADNLRPDIQINSIGNVDYVKDWNRFYNILAMQLKATHPTANTNGHIREFSNVTWSYEARQLWEARKGPEPVFPPRGGRERQIQEAVLVSGRSQVEVSDVWPFLR